MVGAKKLSIAFAVVFACTQTSAILADDEGHRKGHADLSGFGENLTLSSPASGTLDVRISKDGNSVDYTLTYEGLPTHVLFAHIHLGRPAINGGVMVFLCANQGGPPAPAPVPPPCPDSGGTVTGTLGPADVIGPTGQGITAGEFEEFLAAMRGHASYGNVHTTQFPGGEIRGQLNFHGEND
jgi:hypothetical protein